MLGRPGSGKSTQFELLKQALPSAHFLSFGTLVRAFMQQDHEAGRRARALLEAGKMLPKFLSTAVWAPYLFAHLLPDQDLVIEGAPRQPFEAESLDSFLEFYGREEVIVINLEVPAEVAIARLVERGNAEGRADDAALESITSRQTWYEEETVPVIEGMRAAARYRVLDIDGTQTIEDIARAITRAVTSSGAP